MWGDSLILPQDFFGFYLITPLAKIDLAHPVGVDWVPLVRVDDHLHISHLAFCHLLLYRIWIKSNILSSTYHKETRVGVDHLGLVTGLQVPKDGRVVEESQVDHVLALLELGWFES